jgi:hypothetical protein
MPIFVPKNAAVVFLPRHSLRGFDSNVIGKVRGFDARIPSLRAVHLLLKLLIRLDSVEVLGEGRFVVTLWRRLCGVVFDWSSKSALHTVLFGTKA